MAAGKIVQVQGPVVDVEFEPGQLPPILNAIRIPRDGEADINGAAATATTAAGSASTNGAGTAAAAAGASGEGVNLGDVDDLVVEVAQHLGNDVVRCVAMASTDGLVRGQAAIDTGGPIAVPVGPETLGRVFNLLGRPIDQRGPIKAGGGYMPIHRAPPDFEDLA